jgi:hypothetical protein
MTNRYFVYAIWDGTNDSEGADGRRTVMSTSSSATGVSCITAPSMAYLPTESLHLLAHAVTAKVLKETIKETLCMIYNKYYVKIDK